MSLIQLAELVAETTGKEREVLSLYSFQELVDMLTWEDMRNE